MGGGLRKCDISLLLFEESNFLMAPSNRREQAKTMYTNRVELV